MGDDAALRAAAYDQAYWQQRYARSGAAFEWFVTLRAGDAQGSAAEAQLAQARLYLSLLALRVRVCCGE